MLLVVLFGAALSFTLGNAAWSYFGLGGNGSAHASVATLNPPTNVVAAFSNPAQRTVDVSWNTPAEPDGIVVSGYYVTRYLGTTPSPACGTSPTDLTTTLSCQDMNLASDSYTYSVTAVFRTWSSGATSTNVTVPAPVLTSLELDVITPTPTAGTNTSLGIVAYDQYGSVFSAYNGPECLSFSGPGAAPDGRVPTFTNAGACSGGNVVDFANGVGTANLTLFDAQTTTLNVTDIASSVLGSTTLSVAPGTLQLLSVSPESPTPVAGTPFATDLTALDQYGNVDSNYSGAQCVAFSGPTASPDGDLPTYPSSGTCATGSAVNFAAGVASGVNAPNITLFDAVGGVLSARDVPTGANGFAGLTVSPGVLKTFALGSTPIQVAGTTFPVSVTALDEYGNTDSNYSGSQCLVFSGGSDAPDGTGPSYGIPGSCTSGTQVSFVAGVADGANVVPITLFNAQATSLVATDPVSGATGLVNLSVGPAVLDSFSLAPSNSDPVAGNPITVGITALDQYGNIDSNYTGSECVAFSGASNAPDGTGPSYPGAGSCTAESSEVTFKGGVASGGDAPIIAFYDSQPLDLIATDVPTQHFGSIPINVTPGTLSSFAVIPDSHTVTAGTQFDVRLSALDQYQNVDANFTGPQCITFTGPDPAPSGITPIYPVPGSCATGFSAVTFASGYVDGRQYPRPHPLRRRNHRLDRNLGDRHPDRNDPNHGESLPDRRRRRNHGHHPEHDPPPVVRRGGRFPDLYLGRRVRDERQYPHGIGPIGGPVRKSDRKHHCRDPVDRYSGLGPRKCCTWWHRRTVNFEWPIDVLEYFHPHS